MLTGIISFIVILGVLVFLHEFGHFIVAKSSGVQVDEFGFGFPPRVLKLFTWRGTTFTMNALPIGGFVKMAEDNPEVPNSLASKRRLVRAGVYIAGPIMNVLLAAILFAISYSAGTLEPYQGPGAGVYGVSVNSPAEAAGIEAGDNIISINGQTITDPNQVSEITSKNLGSPITIIVDRNGKQLAPITLVPRVSPPAGEGAIGISVDLPLHVVSYPVWKAVPLGFRATYYSVRNLFMLIAAAFRHQAVFQVSGPIGIYRVTQQVAKTGLVPLVEFAGFLSINFAIVNLLPLPALDGGRLLFVIIEWLRRGRKIPPEKEGLVHTLGFIALLALMAVITVIDYIRYYR
ncbi:MAG: M50 family metallopeptidase [Anaerolineae bacterium]